MYQLFKKDLLYLCAEVGVSAHRADPFYLVRLAINKRNNKCWLGCRGKAPPIHHSGKYKSVHSLQKSLWILPKKIKLTLPYYPAILFLGTCLRDSMLAWHRDACSSMFLVVLFTITNLCK